MGNIENRTKLFSMLRERFSFLDLTDEDLEKIYLEQKKQKDTARMSDKAMMESALFTMTYILVNKDDSDRNEKYVINEYINSNFKFSLDKNNNPDYKNALACVKDLIFFIRRIGLGSDPNLYMDLIKENVKLSAALGIIVNEKNEAIQKGKIEDVYNDSALVSMIDFYCSIHDVFIGNKSSAGDYGVVLDDNLRIYLNEIGQYPVLSRERQLEEARKSWRGDKKAYDLLVNSNLRLVVSIAKRYANKGVHLMDLIQEGNIGLMKAVDKFDPEKGYSLSTYATWWIRQGITRELLNNSGNIKLPIHLHEKIKKYNAIIESFRQETGRDPSLKEIAKRMKISEDEAYEISTIRGDTVSINTLVGDEESTELGELIPSEEESLEDQVYKKTLQKGISRIFDEEFNYLTPREKIVIAYRFGFATGQNETLEATGKVLHITRERVRQIQRGALRKLRNPRAKKELEDCSDRPTMGRESKPNKQKKKMKDATSASEETNIQPLIEEPKIEFVEAPKNEFVEEPLSLNYMNFSLPVYFYPFFLNFAKTSTVSAVEKITLAYKQLDDEEKRIVQCLFGPRLDKVYCNNGNAPKEENDFLDIIVPKMIELLKGMENDEGQKQFTKQK